MLKFTASKATLQRQANQKVFVSIFFVLWFAGVISMFWSARPRQLGSLAPVLFVIVALGASLVSWFFWNVFSQQAKAAASQRLTFDSQGVINTNSAWTQVYAYKDVEKLIVRRSSSNEVTGVVLQLPKKLVDLATLERQDDLYATLIEKLPEVPVETQSMAWQRTKSIGGVALLMLGAFSYPIIFPESEWIINLGLASLMLYLGAKVLWGRERVSGPVSPKQHVWIYFLMAAMFAVNVIAALVG